MATYTIRVKGGPSFPCPDHKPILFAAWEHGVTLPYSCQVGGCGTCVAMVINGRVDHSRERITDLPRRTTAGGGEPVGVPAQLCKAYPLSDCTILRPSRTPGKDVAS
jgi:ferredoxin